ncbi:hypothetical protein [Algoriphagus chordae]|uniref:Uncharacterized protein n=1 Tax=Algoriphagus chordae TaxID=237019 RepID=A0A2W7RGG5_9BACT|nr:hypothetical protein [Algoriphagus chordae]PZX58196.1 hypothetical protein LV85_00382 [Algoriphagus chordae]
MNLRLSINFYYRDEELCYFQIIRTINAYRDTLKGDFKYKVKAMNELTEGLVKKS